MFNSSRTRKHCCRSKCSLRDAAFFMGVNMRISSQSRKCLSSWWTSYNGGVSHVQTWSATVRPLYALFNLNESPSIGRLVGIRNLSAAQPLFLQLGFVNKWMVQLLWCKLHLQSPQWSIQRLYKMLYWFFTNTILYFFALLSCYVNYVNIL